MKFRNRERLMLKGIFKKTLIGLTLIVLFIFFLFPLYWLMVTSLKDIWEVYAQPPTFVPVKFTLEGFHWLVSGGIAFSALFNSVIITGTSTVLAMILGTMAGYVLARFPARVGGEKIAFWMLTTRMFPPIVVALPLFFFYHALGLVDTYLGLIFAHLTFNLPLVVWLTRYHFRALPVSYEEAAYVDGCSFLKTFRKIVIPLVYPGLIATAALSWVFAWNEFLFALVLTRRNVSPYTRIIPVLASGHQIYWNRIAALSLVAAVFPIILIFILRNHLAVGFSWGAVDKY